MANKSAKPKVASFDNRKAFHEFHLEERYTAGISLTGSEVKSMRAGGVSFVDSYVTIKRRECFLVGCNISKYGFARGDELSPTRERKLLLNRDEIAKLDIAVRQKGLTIVPLRAFFSDKGKCKIEIATAKGKKLHDKRESIKEREAKKYLARVAKR